MTDAWTSTPRQSSESRPKRLRIASIRPVGICGRLARRTVPRLLGRDHARHLSNEQRVPTGVGVDRSDQPVARLPADRPRDHHRYRLLANATQGDYNLCVGGEIGEELLRLVAAVVVSGERGDQDGPCRELA